MKKRGTFFSGHTAAAVIVIITFGFLPKAMSQVREVPFPYPTIQKAIDAAANGDTVLVHRGTYRGTGNRDLDFHNKKITVKSEDPGNPDKVADTIIDCQGGPNNSHRGFIFQSGEDAESVLTGFTIINGYIRDDGQDGSLSAIDGIDGLESRGGAIFCINGSSPTIRNCIIRDCHAEGGWGGNGADGGEIEPNGGNGGNAGAAYGGAIYCGAGCNPIIRSCTVSNCTVLPGTPGSGGGGWDGNSGPPAGDGGNGGDANDAYGGAVYFEGGGMVLISSCVISDCNAVRNPVAGSAGPGGSNGGNSGSAGEAVSFACGGGVYYGEENLVAMNETTVTGNSAGSEAGGIYYDVNSILVMADCNITGNSAESGSAGGILIHHGATATLDNCNIRGNIANSYDLEYTIGYGGGGGIWCSTGTLSLNGCNIEQNIAGGPVAVGGGIYAGDFERPFEATVDINDCTISGNIADYGGAACVLGTFLKVRDSNLFDNTANYGAGLYFVFSDANIAGSSFTNNSATDLSGGGSYCSGGGLYSSNSSSLITHCVFAKNSAEGSGGGMFLIGPFFPGGSQEITNCLITGNSAILDGGGISSNIGAMPELTNCTLADNDADDILSSGGGLSCYDSDVNIVNSILWHNTGAYGPQIAIGDPMETENPLTRVFVEYSSVQGGEADVFVGQSTDPASGPMLKWLTGNIVDDPNLVPTSDIDTSANYYLSHIPAGQLVDSPCIDAGLGTAAALAAAVGNALTTRTDHEGDSGTVDMGYHHQVAPGSIRQYPLTISVDGNEGGVLYAEWGGAGAGSIAAPNSVLLNAGTIAELTAVADTNNGYTVGDWSGTDDDATPGSNKTVTMYRSRVVRVGMPSNVLLVPSQYSTIEDAVDVAKTGDVIVVSPRLSQDGHIIPYTVSHEDGIKVDNKTITITSEDPLDPNVVARTIIDCQGSIDYPKRAFQFINTGNRSVLTGFTIINGFTIGDKGADGQDDINDSSLGSGQEGDGTGYGGAILVENGSKPTISYCVISDCTVIGGVGGNGGKGLDFNHPNNPSNDANDGWPGGRGKGNGYGGAIYVGFTSDAFIYGCTIINNTAGGGFGGNGGAGGKGSDSALAGSGGRGGRGSGYGEGGGIYCKHARIENCIIENNRTYGGTGGKGGAIGSEGSLEENDVRVVWPGGDGSQTGVGYGGGVCTAATSDPCIIDCNFIGNYAKGHSGSWEFPAGGALYVDASNKMIYLTGCSFEENYIGDTYEELESGEINYWRATGAGNGGALYCGINVRLFITDSMFIRNNNHNGSSYFKINELEFLYPNDEEGSAGGAIYLSKLFQRQP
jgi:hypothetical protein